MPAYSALIKRSFVGLIVGLTLTFLPVWAVSLWPILEPANWLLVPGMAISLALYRNIHTYSPIVMISINVLFYGSATYMWLRLRKPK